MTAKLNLTPDQKVTGWKTWKSARPKITSWNVEMLMPSGQYEVYASGFPTCTDALAFCVRHGLRGVRSKAVSE